MLFLTEKRLLPQRMFYHLRLQQPPGPACYVEVIFLSVKTEERYLHTGLAAHGCGASGRHLSFLGFDHFLQNVL